MGSEWPVQAVRFGSERAEGNLPRTGTTLCCVGRELGEIPNDRVSARKGDQRGKARGGSGDALAVCIRRAKSRVRSAGWSGAARSRAGTAGNAWTPNRKPKGTARENAKQTPDARVGPKGSAWDERRTLRATKLRAERFAARFERVKIRRYSSVSKGYGEAVGDTSVDNPDPQSPERTRGQAARKGGWERGRLNEGETQTPTR